MSDPASAIELKEKGNAAFAGKQFEEAEGFYSRAIAMLGEDAPHTLFGNRAAARLSLGRPQEALEDAEVAIKKDGTWLKGFHRKACAHNAMGEPEIALETYRHALDVQPGNKWLLEQLKQAKATVVSSSKTKPIASLDAWVTVFESMSDSRERLSTLAHLWNQCRPQDRHQIFGQFLTLIAGAGSAHTGVKLADFTEERMVPLPMDNYEDLKPVDTWMSFFREISREQKVEGFKRMWEATDDREKNVIVNDLRHFFLDPLIDDAADEDDDDEELEGDEEAGTREGGGENTNSSDKTDDDSASSAPVVGAEDLGPSAGIPGA